MAMLQRAYNSQKCIRMGGQSDLLWIYWRTSDLVYRYRGCRQRLIPPHLLRNVGKLVIRWLLQGLWKVCLVDDANAEAGLQKEAIVFCWELLTEVYKLPKDRLYVTYFGGDLPNSLLPDEETRQIWLDRGLEEDHILAGSVKDNFWGKSVCDFVIVRLALFGDLETWTVLVGLALAVLAREYLYRLIY